MKLRILGAIMGLAVLVPFVYLGGAYFLLLMWCVGIVGLYEFAQMQGLPVKNQFGILSVLAYTANFVPDYYIPTFLQGMDLQYLFFVCCILMLTFTVFNYREYNIENVAVMVVAALYLGYGLQYVVVLRDLGFDTLLYLFLVIWSTDIGAYLVGRAIGRNKLAPVISPNKTLEGMFGGVIISLIAGIAYIAFIQPDLGPVENIWFLTVALSFVGQFGDLVESAFKRHFKVKDSGNFLPGHGGMLDRFDSTLFASITLMIWFNLFS